MSTIPSPVQSSSTIQASEIDDDKVLIDLELFDNGDSDISSFLSNSV